MTSAEFKDIAPTLPAEPGIYKYYDAGNTILYVGKAKHLKKRISSYFNKNVSSYKTYELVKRIARNEFTIVNSEQDAFLLENTLIKKFQPRYNINLKDDKSYPFIVIKNEPFPRVFLTRRVINDGSEYLGPYTSVAKVQELLDFIKQTIQLRNCSLNLTEANIRNKKFKLCLEYHLGNCKAPCEGKQTEEDYDENISLLKDLLRGKLQPVIRHFKDDMKQAVADLDFENAERLKKKIEFLQNYQSRSLVAGTRAPDADVFSVSKEADKAFINFLMVRGGSVIQTKTIEAESHMEEQSAEILGFSVAQMRVTFKSDAPEIIVPFPVEYPLPGVRITVPRGGDRKKLLDLSEKNARHFIEELKNRERLQLNKKHTGAGGLFGQVQADLKLPQLPRHIECIDNSNVQGSYPVSAMVCFKDGMPSKKDYRHFNVKTVKGIDDFATMKEAVFRRYKRLKLEDQPLPELVIIDGGKGQLGAALEAIDELGLVGKLTLVGLAKNEEEIFFSGDRESLKLSLNSPSLKFIRRIRDEVHRFGISFHRSKRSRGVFKNELEEIPGIGKSTAELLLNKFRSVKNIRTKTREELAEIVGESKAAIISKYYIIS